MDIYLDNAATTLLEPAVLEAMLPYMTHLCGNPSSVHRYGCHAKAAIEKARKKIAALLQVTPSEIVFTSGATEGNNMLLRGFIEAMSIAHVLTSHLEHPSVRMPLEQLAQQEKIILSYVEIDAKGTIVLDAVESWLRAHPSPTLLSFMQVNNEIGNITDIITIGALCQKYGAFLHSDIVQAMYCTIHNLNTLPIHLAACSAHKIHGPKGTGFVYIRSNVPVLPLIYGGNQELNRRGGTENVAHIVGMAKAVELIFKDRHKTIAHLISLKTYMVELLKTHIAGIVFHGHSESITESSPTILNISLPTWKDSDMLIYKLSIHGIAASAGSACASGSQVPSSVVAALQQETNHTLRFSFSKYTTHIEIKNTVEMLVAICNIP